MTEHDPTDDEVITRLRAALDEVAAASPAAAPPEPPRMHDGLPARRWMAIAAAAALVVAGIAAIAANRGGTGDGATTPTEPAPTEPSVTEATTPADPVGWYTLDSPDLVPGEEVVELCCPPMPAPGPVTVMAWGATTGLQDGLLLLRAEPTIGGEPVVTYTSHGLSPERRQQLEGEVVPGSGLPYVLPDDGMVLLGSGFDGIGALRSQVYSKGDERVTISVGDYRGQLTPLANGFRVQSLAGIAADGYRFDTEDGTHVVWQAPNGQWATLDISAGLMDRADDIISAVVPSATDVPPPTTAEQTPPDTVYTGVVSGIIDTGSGPMIAFGFLTSLPPQGGDIRLGAFDWDMVEGEKTLNGTTWIEGPVSLIGWYDGTTFTLTAPPVASLDPPSGPTHTTLTEGCTLETMAPMLDALGTLDYRALGIISSGDYSWDGHCGVEVTAAFDTPGLRDALATVGDDVTVTIVFHEVQP